MTTILTPSQTSGPLFGFSLLGIPVSDAVDPSEQGAINIRGRIFDGQGKPLLLEALVELWSDGQAARARTSKDGYFCVTMRKPASSNTVGVVQAAAALNVQLFARGLSRHLVTRLYFPDEQAANEADPILALVEPSRRQTLIAKSGDESGTLYFDIHLQGENETVFFEIDD